MSCIEMEVAVLLKLLLFVLALCLMALVPQPKVFPWVSMDAPNAFDPIPPKRAE